MSSTQQPQRSEAEVSRLAVSTLMANDLPPEDCALLWLAIIAQRIVAQRENATLATLEAAYVQNCGPLPVTP